MHTLTTLCASWDKINRIIGGCTAALVLLMVLLQSGIVLARSAFNFGNLASQDAVLYMHAALIMLCLSWAFLHDGHVRVDVFYHRFSPLRRAWINCLGNVLFLLPFAAFLCFSSWDYAIESWQNREASGDAGGLDRIYWLKALLPISGGLLFIQGLSDTARQLLFISVIADEDTPETC